MTGRPLREWWIGRMRSVSLYLGVPAACAMMAMSMGRYFLSGFGPWRSRELTHFCSSKWTH
jgi:hypothetical protein